MKQKDIIEHNERVAEQKICKAYKEHGLTEAMELCKTYTGIEDLKPLYNKTCGICYDLIAKEVPNV